ncbi:TPA: hypothetical protein HA231_03715 [Candidatus Woesearchaeota archaeon]|nr:hypothetical protein [Candidatus Woesearchaeota archaeon]
MADILKSLKRLLRPLEFTGRKVASLVNAMLLTVTYFTAVAATAIAAKIFRKKFLELKQDRNAKTYWHERKKEDHTKKEAYRAF